MKKTALRLLPFGLFFAAAAAALSAPAALPVTVEDLKTADVPGVALVEPSGTRFRAPVKYFRIDETIPATEAKKDCADCGNLVAVYAAEVASTPIWASEPRSQFIKVGARLQVLAFLPSKKLVIIVTAPSEATARKISSALTAKFSR